MAEETTKKQLREKLFNERKMWRQRIARQDEIIQQIRLQSDAAVEQIKRANHNLVSSIIRKYGKELDSGAYEIRIPVPDVQ